MNYTIHIYFRYNDTASNESKIDFCFLEHHFCAVIRFNPFAICMLVIKILSVLMKNHIRNTALNYSSCTIRARHPGNINLAIFESDTSACSVVYCIAFSMFHPKVFFTAFSRKPAFFLIYLNISRKLVISCRNQYVIIVNDNGTHVRMPIAASHSNKVAHRYI